nr:MAG TPA: Integrase [Caudoviricetes sp.]
MASIEKRGKNSWRLVVETGTGPDGKRKKKTRTIKIEDKALLRTTKRLRDYLEDQLHVFKAEVEAGEYIKPEKMLFKDFVEKQWKPKYAKKDLERSTQAIYLQHMRVHILPYFGHMELDNIRTMHIVDFKNYIGTPEARKDKKNIPLGNGTQRYILRVLRSVFCRAKEWKFLKENPCDGVKWPKAPKQNIVVYEDWEIVKILEALKKESTTWRLMILGTFLGGFRRGEMTALELDDLNFGDNMLTIDKNIPMKIKGEFIYKDPKSGDERFVKMPGWYMDELKKYCTQWKLEKIKIGTRWQGGDKSFVFHKGNGVPYHPNTPTNWWRNFLKKNHIRHVKLHGLRHTSATYLLENGATIKSVQERLGHSTEKITEDTYSHVTKRMEQKVADEFDRFKDIFEKK